MALSPRSCPFWRPSLFLLQFPSFPRPTSPHLKCREVAGYHSKADPVPFMHPPQNFTHAIPRREKDPQFAPNSGVLGRLPRGVLTPAWKSDSRGRARTIAGGGLALLTRAQRGWLAGLHGQAETRALRSREAGEDASRRAGAGHTHGSAAPRPSPQVGARGEAARAGERSGRVRTEPADSDSQDRISVSFAWSAGNGPVRWPDTPTREAALGTVRSLDARPKSALKASPRLANLMA